MKKALLTTVVLLVTLGTASAAEFYVVQDTSNKQCRVVESKPSGSTTTIVGGETRVYNTRADAEAALKSNSACSNNTAGNNPPAGNVRVMNEAPANAVTVANYYKQSVYDPQNSKIGEIDDTLVNNEGRIVAHVIGVGGFLGMGEKHVLVPFTSVKGDMKDNKWVLTMNTTKDELKNATGFKYDRSKTTWIKEEPKTTGSR
jgi:sporulation protein YlmC with PRC-barrel domain